MTWLEDRYSGYEKLVSDRNCIQQHADRTFGALWSELMNVVTSAREKGMNLQTNGDTRKRHIVMVIPGRFPYGPDTKTRRLVVELSGDLRSIAGTSDAGVTKIDLEVCPDGIVCFSHEGRQIEHQEASRLIMEPFLFEGQSPFSARAVLGEG